VLAGVAAFTAASTSAPQVLGVLLVAAGILLVRGLSRGRGAAFGVLIACCIAGYTVVDKHGVSHASPIAYLELITAFTGTAYAAGLAAGVWSGLDELRANYAISRRWEPVMDDDTRTAGLAGWRRGVDRTLGLAAPEPVGAGAA